MEDLSHHWAIAVRVLIVEMLGASASPVLQNVIKSSNRIVKIHGVPDAAVTAFVAFLYSARCTEEDMDKYGMHLLALSHVYMVKQLKQRCIKGLGDRASTENVVDVLQLARLCDAPDLYLKCVKCLTNRFKAVKETEGWRFLQNHDPCLELEILRFMEEDEKHICTEGCTEVGPLEVEVGRGREPCSKFGTCQGLQNLIRHFVTCERVKGRCLPCKRMWQLFKLHSSICLRHDSCKVPLCRKIRLRMEEEKKKGDARWEVLVRKVASAKAMSFLALPKRKRVEEIRGEGQ
ncbi:hypothetical protein ACSQ67_019499 [Phaseolus vulgaris]